MRIAAISGSPKAAGSVTARIVEQLERIGGEAIPLSSALGIVRAARGWGSPGNAQESPGNTLESPGNALGSPGNTLGSLGNTLGSPGNTLESPGKTLGSPGNAQGSQEYAQAPTQIQRYPHENAQTPRKSPPSFQPESPAPLEALLDADALLIAFPLYVDGLPAPLIEALTRLESIIRTRNAPARSDPSAFAQSEPSAPAHPVSSDPAHPVSSDPAHPGPNAPTLSPAPSPTAQSPQAAHPSSLPRSLPRVYALCNCGFYEPAHTALALNMVRHFADGCGLPWGYGVGVGCGPMLASMGKDWSHGPASGVSLALSALLAAMRAGASGPDVFTAPRFPRALYKAAAQMGWRRQAGQNGVRGQLRAQPYAAPAEWEGTE